MSIFESNIISLQGKTWLKTLKDTISNLSQEYGLSNLIPVANLSYNYVLTGFQGKQPIILKLSFDKKRLKREAAALRVFAKFGALKIFIEQEGVLILERAIPGVSLKASIQIPDTQAIIIACHKMQQLHQAPIPLKHNFSHIKDWLALLDKDWDIPAHYLLKARQLRDQLLKIPAKKVLLHGDLHFDNILQNGKDWLVIDPKGVIGSPVNEVWAFIKDIERDSKFIANFFDFELQQVKDWYFVHLILAVCWNLEDNLDTKLFLELAAKAYIWVS